MLDAHGIGYRAGGKWLLRDVSLRAAAGEFIAILGPNGAGKTTLLRLLGGELPPAAGAITLNGLPLDAYTPNALALERACLTQVRAAAFPFTAYEVAFMGRLPHAAGRRERPEDHDATRAALRETGMERFEDRLYPSLSGGEATRVDLARCFAQRPRLLLLDEPTNHLDLGRQLEILDNCHARARAGAAVVAVLHELNLASVHADRIILLHEGRVAAEGTPEEVVTAENIQAVYGVPCEVWPHPCGRPWIAPCIKRRHGVGRNEHATQCTASTRSPQGAPTKEEVFSHGGF